MAEGGQASAGTRPRRGDELELDVETLVYGGRGLARRDGFVVFVERAQRRITVNYAKQQRGRQMYGGQSTNLPLKLNMAGVIPPIFASSIILFPATIAGWFGNAQGMGWLRDLSTTLSPGQPLYVMFYAAAIIFFCFFLGKHRSCSGLIGR